MPVIIMCGTVCIIMFGATIIQVQLTVHFWDTFSGGNPQIKALIIGAATCMALLEFFLLAVSAECRRRGFDKYARRALFVFAFTFLGNFAADYSAFVSLTADDRDARVQAAQIYEMDQTRFAQLERDIAALQGQLQAGEMNIPSASIAAMLSAQQERAERYRAADAEVPLSIVRRIAQLESARISAERLEALQAEREEAANALRERDAVPQAVHPQFEAIAGLLGNMVSPEQVRSALPVILVIAFKSAVMFLFGILAAILGDIWGQRTATNAGDNDTTAPDAGFDDQPPGGGPPPSDGGEGRGGGGRPSGLPGNADLFDLFEQMDGRPG